MNLKLAQEKLVEVIRSEGSTFRQGMQIHRRSLELLPQLLKNVMRNEFSHLRGARALRHAMNSQTYRNHIEAHLKTSSETMHAKINFETYRMLYQARQSIRRANLSH